MQTHELLPPQAGCGVGNTALPLLTANPGAHVFACDFSAKAIELLRAAPGYDAARITAFVADLAHDRLRDGGRLPQQGVDVCTLVFVLSALDPSLMPQARRLPAVPSLLRAGACPAAGWQPAAAARSLLARQPPGITSSQAPVDPACRHWRTWQQYSGLVAQCCSGTMATGGALHATHCSARARPDGGATASACAGPGAGNSSLAAPLRGRTHRRDLAQQRLASTGRAQQLGPNFFLRMEGTKCYYFTQARPACPTWPARASPVVGAGSSGACCGVAGHTSAGLTDPTCAAQEVLVRLFEDAGFMCRDVRMVERTVANRARGLQMQRRWIQGTFIRRTPGQREAACAAGALPSKVRSDGGSAAGPSMQPYG